MFHYCTIEGDYVTGCAQSVAGVPEGSLPLTQEQYENILAGLKDSTKLVQIDPQTLEITLVERPLTPGEIATQARIALRDAFKTEIDGDNAATILLNAQPAQIGAWIDANINTIADVRWAFKVILKLLGYCLRK